MASQNVKVKHILRNDTLENWVAQNPILDAGETVVVNCGTAGTKFKVGDGTTNFIELPFSGGTEEVYVGTDQPVGDQVLWINPDGKIGDVTQDIQQLSNTLSSLTTDVMYHTENQSIHTRSKITIKLDLDIPATGWVLEDQGVDFPYYIELSCDGALVSYSAEVTVDKESIQPAVECGLCPTMETRDGMLKFWAQDIPTAEILCHATLFWDGVSYPVDGSGHGTVNLGYPANPGGFIEMEESIPAEQRKENVLYALILADFESEEVIEA